MVNVCICVTDSQNAKLTEDYFSASGEFAVTVCSAPDEFREKCAGKKFDGLVLDADFPEAAELVGGLPRNNRPKIMTAKRLSDSETSENAFGCDDVIYKPYSFSELKAKLLKLLDSEGKQFALIGGKALDERLSNIFIRTGIPPHIKGYQFLRVAVKLAIAQPEIVNSMTKKLYPTIARKFDTSPSKVERAIRHAIEVSWARGKIENVNVIFGIKIYGKGEKPTNGEFIALIADKMLIEMMPDDDNFSRRPAVDRV